MQVQPCMRSPFENLRTATPHKEPLLRNDGVTRTQGDFYDDGRVAVIRYTSLLRTRGRGRLRGTMES